MGRAEGLATEFTEIVDFVLNANPELVQPSTSIRLEGHEVALNGLIYHRGILPKSRASGSTYGGRREPFDGGEAVWKIVPQAELVGQRDYEMQLAVGQQHHGRIYRVLDQVIGVRESVISTSEMTSSRELDEKEASQLITLLGASTVQARDLKNFKKMSVVESARHSVYTEEWLSAAAREYQRRVTARYARGNSRTFPRRARSTG